MTWEGKNKKEKENKEKHHISWVNKISHFEKKIDTFNSVEVHE